MILGDDNLDTVCIIRAGYRVLENTDGTDNFAFLDDAHLAAVFDLARTEVARITNNLLSLDGLLTAPDADELAIGVKNNFIYGLVEHVGAAVDGAQTREGLWQLAETVEGVDVGGLAVARHGGGVENDALVRGPRNLLLVATIG